jgi:hypothetical protein
MIGRRGLNHAEDEVLLRKPATLLLIVALAVVSFTACGRHRSGSSDTTSSQTATIAPAQAPAAPTGTEALTQTVDVEDGRSEDEGGALVNTKPAAKTPDAKKPAPAPVKKNTKKH